MTPLDGVGLVGVAVLLAAYGLTVSGRLAATRPAMLAANLVGALLILASLWGAFNLASALIEGAWAAIALGGLIRHARRR